VSTTRKKVAGYWSTAAFKGPDEKYLASPSVSFLKTAKQETEIASVCAELVWIYPKRQRKRMAEYWTGEQQAPSGCAQKWHHPRERGPAAGLRLSVLVKSWKPLLGHKRGQMPSRDFDAQKARRLCQPVHEEWRRSCYEYQSRHLPGTDG